MEERLDKDAWMTAARLALLHRGPEAVRVEPLARELGVTKGSFYWHFRDRADLLEALLVEWEDETQLLTDALRLAKPKDALPDIVAELDRRNVASERGESPSDAAIFAWAAADPGVARRVNKVEAERMELFRRLTGRKELADLFFYAYHGFLLRRRRVPGAAGDFAWLGRMVLQVFGARKKRVKTRTRAIAAGLFLTALLPLEGCTTYRILRWRDPSAHQTKEIFAQRAVRSADVPFTFAVAPPRTDLDTVSVRDVDFRMVPFDQYVRNRRIKAFVVIRNDSIVYERYTGGYADTTRSSSFSVAKSITSALVGIALQSGAIRSLDDSVVRYLPELADRPAFVGLTLRHLVTMQSGFEYSRTTGSIWHDFRSSDAHFYYTTNLHASLARQRREVPPGTRWAYKDSDTQLLAWVLERATGKTLAAQLEEGVWRRIGTEKDASWDLDRRGGSENAASGLNATARDLARFGRLYLHGGNWNGAQIVPGDWVRATTTLDSSRREPEVATWWQMQHRGMWWLPMHNWGAEQDFFADGSRGQRIYVNRRLRTVIVQLADESAQDFPFRKVAHYLAGERYTYPRVIANQLSAAISGGASADSVRALYAALLTRMAADPAGYTSSRASLAALAQRLQSERKPQMAEVVRSLLEARPAKVAVAAPHAQAAATVIRAGRLFDPVSGTVQRNQVIVVENGQITAVGPTAQVPAGAEVIDLSDMTVLPGLIDAHVHLAIGGLPRDNALADLRAGFTTIVDLGSRTTRMLRIRDSINAGQIPGPRVLASGMWVGTQGGVCEFNGLGLAGGPDAFRARVRENVAGGADIIKVCVSGWPAAAFARPDEYEIADAALEAVVQEAGAANRLVVAHDISVGGVRAALRFGVDGLAHAAYVDSAVAVAMKSQNVFMIPTLASLTAQDPASPASRALVAATTLAHRVGVPLVFGTDGGVLPHGRNAEEFLALRSAGVSPLAALRAATVNAARAFRIADSVGTIAPGKSADIIAVRGDPLTDLEILRTPVFVMARGRVVIAVAQPESLEVAVTFDDLPAVSVVDRSRERAQATWLHRWAITAKMPASTFAGEPEVPDRITRLSQPKEALP